jgi:hypothetical protein
MSKIDARKLIVVEQIVKYAHQPQNQAVRF